MKDNQIKQRIDSGMSTLVKLGGLCAALFAPACIGIVGFVLPFADAATLTFLLKLLSALGMKIMLFLIMVLPIWYGLDTMLRILSSLLLPLRRAALLFYGLAFAWSAHVGYVLFILEHTT